MSDIYSNERKKKRLKTILFVALSIIGVGAISTAITVPVCMACSNVTISSYSVECADEISSSLINKFDLKLNSDKYEGKITLKDSSNDINIDSITIGTYPLKSSEYSYDASSKTLTISKEVMTSHTGEVKIKVSLKTIAVTGITLNKTSTSIEVGATDLLTATVLPENATDKSYSWSSSNQLVATVVDGVVTGVETGSVTITATTVDGNFTATCQVTVTNPVVPVTGVTLSDTTASLTVGDTKPLTETVTPSDATNKKVTWSSSNTDVATVDDGIVTAKAAGNATITVTTEDGNKTATCEVTVTNPVVHVESVTLNKTASNIVVGNTETLTVTIKPDNATNKSVTWSSSDEGVATVDNGVVTAVSNGSAIITATSKDDNSKKASCTITVKDVVSGITLNRTSLSVGPNVEYTLTATVTPDSAIQGVTWSSDDSNIATVDENGKVTAKAVGTATITASAKDGSGKKATCAITVYDTSGLSFSQIGSTTTCSVKWDYSTALSSVNIPEIVKSNDNQYTVASIDEYAFYKPSTHSGSEIENIIIPDSVTSIGQYAFESCSQLTSIIIPDSVTTIGYSCFDWCSSLASIKIGKNVTSIGNYAFRQCNKLKTVTIDSETIAKSSSNSHNLYDNATTVYVPKDCNFGYKDSGSFTGPTTSGNYDLYTR